MCDTLYAAPEITKNQDALFAKNSDRPPNEAQHLAWFPGKTYKKNDTLRCTYLEIPQVEETRGVLLSKPFWMWGAEMGINEDGVVIGNEAVFSKIPANKEPSLLGMDLLRLGLERARTSQQALEVITSLLEEFGQGGNCIQEGHLYYHNSFLIADPREAWVLETVDRHWAASRVSPFYSISNLLSIKDSWELSSAGLEGWIKSLNGARKDINLTRDLSDFIYSTFADGGRRCQRTRNLLSTQQGEIGIQTMAAILREHNAHPVPTSGIAGADICMHASLGPIRVSQTTGSMIVSLSKGNSLVLATGTAAPCTGIFKPIWVDAPPDLPNPDPTGSYDPKTIFWSHERLHREVMKNYFPRLTKYKAERDALEQDFIRGANEINGSSREERKSYSELCFRQAQQATERWLEEILEVPEKQSPLYAIAWRDFNNRAGLNQ